MTLRGWLAAVDLDKRMVTTPRALVAVMWIFTLMGAAMSAVGDSLQKGLIGAAAVQVVFTCVMVAPVVFWARNWRQRMTPTEESA